MQFSDLYKSPKSPLSRLRHQAPLPLHPSPCDWDPDLFSRDKEKQKSAVRRYLEEKVRNDWEFQWPPVSRTEHTAGEVVAEANDQDSNNQDNGDNGNSGLAAATADAQQKEEPTGGGLMHAAEDNPTPNTASGGGFASTVAADPASRSATGPSPHQSQHSSHDDVRDAESRDPGYDADSGSDVESEYSTMSEDPVHYRPRTEWESGEETDDDEISYASSPLRLRSPYRFDSPDSVGQDVLARTLQKKAERRREVRKEMKWNDGLACFQVRRDLWTGAKTVRLKPAVHPRNPREGKPLSPLSPRRLFMRGGSSIPSSPVAGTGGIAPLSLHASQSSGDSGDGEAVFSVRETTSKDTNASSTDDNDAAAAAIAVAALEAKKEARKHYPVVTLLPNPQPLLPPDNPMRASITPGTYNSIFEKIVLQGMTPSCPVNLGDMVNACVAGWKRRGEWPPRLTAPEPNFARRKGNNANNKRQQQSVVKVGMVPPVQPPKTKRSQGSQAAATPTAPVLQPPSTAPISPPPVPPSKNEARRKSFSFLTREKSKDKGKERSDGKEEDGGAGAGKAFRRSLHRVLGWHPHHVRGGSVDGLISPTLSKTDPAPAVVHHETAQGRNSQDGLRVSGTIGGHNQNQKASGEARSLGSNNRPNGERAVQEAQAGSAPAMATGG